MQRKTAFVVLLLTIAGCSGGATGPSDDAIKTQIADYLKSDALFTEFFDLSSVDIQDKLLKEKECVAVCKVTVKPKKYFGGGSPVDVRFNFHPQQQDDLGKTKPVQLKFRLEKYEKGWKVIDLVT